VDVCLRRSCPSAVVGVGEIWPVPWCVLAAALTSGAESVSARDLSTDDTPPDGDRFEPSSRDHTPEREDGSTQLGRPSDACSADIQQGPGRSTGLPRQRAIRERRPSSRRLPRLDGWSGITGWTTSSTIAGPSSRGASRPRTVIGTESMGATGRRWGTTTSRTGSVRRSRTCCWKTARVGDPSRIAALFKGRTTR